MIIDPIVEQLHKEREEYMSRGRGARRVVLAVVGPGGGFQWVPWMLVLIPIELQSLKKV